MMSDSDYGAWDPGLVSNQDNTNEQASAQQPAAQAPVEEGTQTTEQVSGAASKIYGGESLLADNAQPAVSSPWDLAEMQAPTSTQLNTQAARAVYGADLTDLENEQRANLADHVVFLQSAFHRRGLRVAVDHHAGARRIGR